MVQTVVLTSDRLIKVIVEEGLWLALMADLALVSGQLKPGKDDFLIAQRQAIIGTLNVLTAPNLGEIPILDIGIGNPLAFLFGWLRPLKDLLETKEVIEIEPGKNINVWKALPPFERMLLVLMLPGLFRLIIKAIAGKIL
jgi:hypothetical protein